MDKTQRNIVLAFLDFHLQQPRYYFLRKGKQLRIKEEKQKTKRALAKLRKDVIEIMPSAIAEYEIELRKCADLTTTNLNPDQPPVMPKKQFPWNNKLRNLLYDVYEIYLASYALLRKRNETLEEFLNTYFRNKVVEIWPNGWMHYEELQREIDAVKYSRLKSKENKIQNMNSMQKLTNNQVKNTEPIRQTATSVIATKPATKRKHAEGESTKPRKNKTQKKEKNSNANVVGNVNKKSLVTTADGIAYKKDVIVNAQASHQQFQPQQQQLQQPQQASVGVASNYQQKLPQQSTTSQQAHSMQATSNNNVKSTHVIDLDKYKSANDILQTSKQLINAAAQQQHQHQQQQLQQQKQSGNSANIALVNSSNYKLPALITKRESSSESDGVEIVSVYHPKVSKSKNVQVTKQKHAKQTVTDTAISNMNYMSHPSNMYMPATATAAATTTVAAAVNLATSTSTKTTFNNNSSATNQNANNNTDNQHHKKTTKNHIDSIDINKIMQQLKNLDHLQPPTTANNYDMARSINAHPQ